MALIGSKEYDWYLVVQLEGDFVSNEDVEQLRTNLRQLAASEKNFAIINLEKTNFLSSAALGVLLSANAIFEKTDGKVVLANMSDYIRHLFKITKLDIIFEIYNSLPEAVEGLKKHYEKSNNS